MNMCSYDDLMPNCHGCPYWEIACVIDNKIGICSVCMSEIKKKEKSKMDVLSIFISQPMKGRTEEEILEERKNLMEYVRKFYPDKQCQEIKSFFPMEIQSKNVPLRMLGMSIELLAEADVAVFAENWDVARGCKLEHECAKVYGIRIIDFD